MGIISLDKISRLYWLGRYTERVFTTIGSFEKVYDDMIDIDADAYKSFCERLNIPDIYTGTENFVDSYLYDKENPDSLFANMNRAYDNAIVLREEISSEVLCYIQLSLDKMVKGEQWQDTMLKLQQVKDYIFAFWGSADDYVDNEDCRNIMKCGKYVERLDLYMRLDYDYVKIEKEFSKLLNRLHRIHVGYSLDNLHRLTEILNKGDNWREDYVDALNALGGILGSI